MDTHMATDNTMNTDAMTINAPVSLIVWATVDIVSAFISFTAVWVLVLPTRRQGGGLLFVVLDGLVDAKAEAKDRDSDTYPTD